MSDSSRDNKLVQASRMSYILYPLLNPGLCFVPGKYSVSVDCELYQNTKQFSNLWLLSLTHPVLAPSLLPDPLLKLTTGLGPLMPPYHCYVRLRWPGKNQVFIATTK